MTDQQVVDEPFLRDFAKRWLEAWNSRDPDQILSLCTPDVVWDESSIPEVLHGHEAVRDQSLRPFLRSVPDVVIEYVGQPYLAVDGSKAAAQWRLEGAMTGKWDPPGFAPTNSPIELAGAEFFEFQEGLVSRYTLLYDALNVGQQIGAVPKPGTGGERMGLFMQKLAARRMRQRARS